MFTVDPRKIKTGAPLAQGSFGKIYAYVDEKKKESKNWVVKHVHAADARELRFFMQEAVLSFNYKNPCVVSNRGYDLKDSPNGGFDLFIKMPRMDTSLRRVIGDHARAKTKPALNNVLRCFYNVAYGLDYLQRKKIIHNNINPGTILIGQVDGENFAKIGGIGLSQHKPWKEGEKGLGTLLYTAPERLKGSFKLDKDTAWKGDVWSLGLTIMEYCLLKLKKYEPEDDDDDWLLGEGEAKPKEEKKMSDEEKNKIGTVMIKENLENLRKEYGRKLGDIEGPVEKLIDILQATFVINPKDRISFKEICERLDQQFPELKMKDKLSAMSNDFSQYDNEYDESGHLFFYNEDPFLIDEESSKNLQNSFQSNTSENFTGNQSSPSLTQILDLNQ